MRKSFIALSILISSFSTFANVPDMSWECRESLDKALLNHVLQSIYTSGRGYELVRLLAPHHRVYSTQLIQQTGEVMYNMVIPTITELKEGDADSVNHSLQFTYAYSIVLPCTVTNFRRLDTAMAAKLPQDQYPSPMED